MTINNEIARKVVNGLLPIVRIAGQDIHWTMTERMAHYGVPATSLAVIKAGEIAWSEGFGVLDTVSATPTNADSVFMGASTSKPVSAFLVLLLVQRGVLDLDADVQSYIRSWTLPDNEFLRQAPVTLRRILTHTAGTTINGWPVVPQGTPVPTVRDLLEGLPPNKLPPVVVDKVPGGTERYSGGGFLLAQMAIEEKTGRSFADLARELIFEPLGMRHTTFEQPLPERLRANTAHGHNANVEPIPGGWMVSAEMAAGGIFTTAPDYARFMIGCRASWLGLPGALLRHDLAEQMMASYPQTCFGLGWRMIGKPGARRFNHGGSNDGYQCEANCYLESGDGAVVMTSSVPGLFLFCEVHNAVADVYGWPDFLLPPKKVVPMSAAEQAAFAGEYRIVYGIELPLLRMWSEDGQLKSEIPGLRVGVRVTYRDENGNLFNQSGPYESRPTFGPDGRVRELAVYEGGDTVILRAVRD